jgi:16S rRNA (cytosine967-C5)-methyltransferase
LDKILKLSANPRLLALDVLVAVEKGEFLEKALNERAALVSPDNLALARALASMTVRHQSRLDFLLATKLTKGWPDHLTLLILRLGLCQILFFDRLGDHAIVDQTVRLTGSKRRGREGLVNAVLRGFLRDRAVFGWPKELDGREVAPLKRLAVFYSHPLWLVEKLNDLLGYRETRALLVANNQPPPPTIRVNPRKISREDLAGRLPFPTQKTLISPWGLKPLAKSLRRPNLWPLYQEGFFAIQDEASQLIGLLGEGAERVLDCCAGLGGKTLAIAAVLPEKGRIWALDPHGGRLNGLKTEAQRLGLAEKIVETKESSLATAKLEGDFDLVIVDAPCSGLGVIRRRPEIKWRKSPGDLPPLAAFQLELLETAAAKVAKGGSLIYAVCSVLAEEGLGVCQQFLAKNLSFRYLAKEELPLSLANLSGGSGQIHLWPHKEGTDGFFYGLLTNRP